MRPIVEAGLGAAIWIAVLAFGGTSIPLFCVAQLTILFLGIFVLFSSLRSPLGIIRLPGIVPVLILILVVLQIAPLPVSLATLFRPQHEVFHASFTFSLAPYQTASALLQLVTYWTAFCLTLMICEDGKARTRLLYVLLALGAFEALYGLLQYLTGWQQIFAYVKKYYLEDATGTYINRNHFAGLLEMVLPFAVALGLHRLHTLRGVALRAQARARAVLCARGLSPLVFAVFLCVIMFSALIFSRSRMGIVSAAAALLAVFACVTMYSRSERTRPLMAALLAFGVIGLVVWIGSDPVITRFETLGQEYRQAGENRISIWSDSLKLVRQHPLLGTGLATFSVAYPAVQTTFLNHQVDHAHCDYLEMASDLGLVGAVLVFGSIVWALAHAVRGCGKLEAGMDNVVRLGCIGSITAILVHSFADFNLYIPGNALVFSVILGLTWSTVLRQEDKNDLRSVHTPTTFSPRRLVANCRNALGEGTADAFPQSRPSGVTQKIDIKGEALAFKVVTVCLYFFTCQIPLLNRSGFTAPNHQQRTR